MSVRSCWGAVAAVIVALGVGPLAPAASGQDRTFNLKVPVNQAWTKTGVNVEVGQRIQIAASGTVEMAGPDDPRAFVHKVPPEGREERDPVMPQPGMPSLALLGKIGEKGTVFLVGKYVHCLYPNPPAFGAGELYLGVNDHVVGDNTGSWDVRVTILAEKPASGSGLAGLWVDDGKNEIEMVRKGDAYEGTYRVLQARLAGIGFTVGEVGFRGYKPDAGGKFAGEIEWRAGPIWVKSEITLTGDTLKISACDYPTWTRKTAGALPDGLRPFQGTWLGVSGESEGMTEVFAGDAVHSTKKGGEPFDTGFLTVDPSKSPKTFDVAVTAGPNKGDAMVGIYKFEGDTLTICYELASAKKARPTEFAAGANGGVLQVWKPKPLAAIPKESEAFEGTWEGVSGGNQGWTAVYEGEKARMYRGSELQSTRIMKVDASQTPKTYNTFSTDDPPKGVTVGIYEIDGDTFRACYVLASDGKPRPTEFAVGGKGGDHLQVWKRKKVAAAPKGLESFQGTWLGAADLEGWSLTFTGDKAQSFQGGVLFDTGVAKVDPTKTPPTYDSVINDGPNKGGAMVGIYKFEGDTLTICYESADKARPTEFAAGDKGGRTQIWKRKKADPPPAGPGVPSKGPPGPGGSESNADLSGAWVYEVRGRQAGTASLRQEKDAVTIELTYAAAADGPATPHYRLKLSRDGQDLSGTWEATGEAFRGEKGKFQAVVSADGDTITPTKAVESGRHELNLVILKRTKKGSPPPGEPKAGEGAFDTLMSAQPVAGEVFTFTNTNSGRCLAVRDGAKDAGAEVVQGPLPKDAGAAARWKVVAAGKYVKLVNQNGEKLLMVSGNAKENGATIAQGDDGDSADRLWHLTKVGNHYAIRSALSDLVVGFSNRTKGENQTALQWAFTKDLFPSDQIWYVQGVPKDGPPAAGPPGPGGPAAEPIGATTLALMDEWLARAVPPQKDGEALRYETWGRVVGRSLTAEIRAGRSLTAEIRAGGPPDTRLTRGDYLWEIAGSLRSANGLGTLKEYVETKRKAKK